MNLLGRIDRVDTYETSDKVYVKIIDYKSGNTSFHSSICITDCNYSLWSI